MAPPASCAFRSHLLLCEPSKVMVKTVVFLGTQCGLPKLWCMERTRQGEAKSMGCRDCRSHITTEREFVIVQQSALLLQMWKLRPRKARWFASYQLGTKVRTKTQFFLLIRFSFYFTTSQIWKYLRITRRSCQFGDSCLFHSDSAGPRCKVHFQQIQVTWMQVDPRPQFGKFCCGPSVSWQMLLDLWAIQWINPEMKALWKVQTHLQYSLSGKLCSSVHISTHRRTRRSDIVLTRELVRNCGGW